MLLLTEQDLRKLHVAGGDWKIFQYYNVLNNISPSLAASVAAGDYYVARPVNRVSLLGGLMAGLFRLPPNQNFLTRPKNDRLKELRNKYCKE